MMKFFGIFNQTLIDNKLLVKEKSWDTVVCTGVTTGPHEVVQREQGSFSISERPRYPPGLHSVFSNFTHAVP